MDEIRNGDIVFDVFNTAYFLGDKGDYQTYHKSKLVPGPETMPYPGIFGFLSDLLVDFGGTSGQLGKQNERTVFLNQQGYGLAPAICYESIYGDFMAQYIRNGAHFIGIITNDGWWRDSPGSGRDAAFVLSQRGQRLRISTTPQGRHSCSITKHSATGNGY